MKIIANLSKSYLDNHDDDGGYLVVRRQRRSPHSIRAHHDGDDDHHNCNDSNGTSVNPQREHDLADVSGIHDTAS